MKLYQGTNNDFWRPAAMSKKRPVAYEHIPPTGRQQCVVSCQGLDQEQMSPLHPESRNSVRPGQRHSLSERYQERLSKLIFRQKLPCRFLLTAHLEFQGVRQLHICVAGHQGAQSHPSHHCAHTPLFDTQDIYNRHSPIWPRVRN